MTLLSVVVVEVVAGAGIVVGAVLVVVSRRVVGIPNLALLKKTDLSYPMTFVSM